MQQQRSYPWHFWTVQVCTMSQAHKIPAICYQKPNKKLLKNPLFKHSATTFNIKTTTCQDMLHIGQNSNNQEYIQEASIQNQVKNPAPCPVSAQRSVSLRKLLIDCFANSGMLHLYVWLLKQVPVWENPHEVSVDIEALADWICF